uniref:Reverse transcriptase domain-containing protein n=1 Tax=Haemonchus contortus TaxID=6289 RepID=A0A7I4XT34_HAECO
MAICTFNSRTLASEACIEDLMMQARKIKYDVIGLTETRRHRPQHAVFETEGELFLGTCDSRGVGGVGVLVNTHLAMSIDSYGSLTARIGRLRLRRCGSTPALTVFFVYAPTSSYDEEELEAFYMDLEKLYREVHTFFKVIIGDFNAKIGPRRTIEELQIGTHGMLWNEQGERLSEFIMSTHTIHGNSQFQEPSHSRSTWESPGGQFHNEIDHIIVNREFCLTDVAVVPNAWSERAAKFRKRSPKTVVDWDHFASFASLWEDSVNDNIDEEYDRLVEHLHDCARRAESLKDVKKRLSSKTLELIRQRGIARATGNPQQTSELAKQCREAIKEDLKERRAAVMDEAAEAGKSIRKARRNFANYKTKMTSLRRPDGTVTASRRAMEKVIYDFYSDLFDSHVYMPTCHLRQDGYVVPSVLPSEIRHAITSMRNEAAPGPDRIKAEHLKRLPPFIVKTLARLFTRYLSQCKVPTSWKTSKTVLLYKKGDPDDIGNYRPICLLSVIYKLFTRVILNRIGRILDEGQPCEQAGFRRGFSTVDHIHTVTRLIEVSRQYKMPLCLTFLDLKKGFDTVETEAVIEALGNQGVPTQYVRMLHELYNNFTTRISPFYREVIINVKRGVRQGDTISPKLFSAALENVMRHMEWESMGVKVDGRYLHHLRFADDIALITRNIEQAGQMLAI